jgi:hypothetical protein
MSLMSTSACVDGLFPCNLADSSASCTNIFSKALALNKGLLHDAY